MAVGLRVLMLDSGRVQSLVGRNPASMVQKSLVSKASIDGELSPRHEAMKGPRTTGLRQTPVALEIVHGVHVSRPVWFSKRLVGVMPDRS